MSKDGNSGDITNTEEFGVALAQARALDTGIKAAIIANRSPDHVILSVMMTLMAAMADGKPRMKMVRGSIQDLTSLLDVMEAHECDPDAAARILNRPAKECS